MLARVASHCTRSFNHVVYGHAAATPSHHPRAHLRQVRQIAIWQCTIQHQAPPSPPSPWPNRRENWQMRIGFMKNLHLLDAGKARQSAPAFQRPSFHSLMVMQTMPPLPHYRPLGTAGPHMTPAPAAACSNMPHMPHMPHMPPHPPPPTPARRAHAAPYSPATSAARASTPGLSSSASPTCSSNSPGASP